MGMLRFITFAVFCCVLAQVLIQQTAANDPVSSAAGPSVEASAVTEQPVSSHAESSSEGAEGSVAEAPGIRRMGKHRSDKSVAGGGVIIGGLVTAIFAAVFCYIRVTRKRGGVY
ncbi:hypothetical protein CRG98_050305 [Punica granatum]|uniref:Uncharacterized protein n=1 Tax=Punica granatum TaxID=22663 RepID=A0A2I0GJZ8_PUNGR|nr:hypothetical protein CRG98_050305 [Punica granatum]